ncbi:hypothetical protein WJX79_004687 [Trebouxia sp. C0005]
MASYPPYDASAYQQPAAYPPPAADPNAYYAAAPPPAYGAPPPAYGYQPHPDEVRTLFLTGFPEDVKERELNNVLRFLPAYEASQMHHKNGMAQGFALFQNGAAARAAVDSLHNMVFCEGAVLRCEVARKNMYLKEDTASKRGKYEHPPAAYPGYPPAAAPGAAPYYPPAGAAAAPAAAAAAANRQYVSVSNTKDNPPCNTLFVGNLGDTVSEAELRQLFGTLAGFRQLKLIRGARSVTCFVEFNDLPSAMACHQNQQGAVLTSSDRGGIRIQYSRNPFGKKRDYDGSFINTPTVATYTAPSYEQPAIAAPAYGSGGAVSAAYSSGDYSAPATAPSADGAQQTNGQAASYDAAAAAQPAVPGV